MVPSALHTLCGLTRHVAALQPTSANEEVRWSGSTYARKRLVRIRRINRVAADIGPKDGVDVLWQFQRRSIVGTACCNGVVGAGAVCTVVARVDSTGHRHADLDRSDLDISVTTFSSHDQLQA